MKTIKAKSKADAVAQKERFVRELFDNYPEASMPSLRCVKWNYRDFIFDFIDDEGAEHRVTLPMALKGLDRLVDAVGRGELPGLGLSAGFLSDTGEWDSFAIDAVAQMAIFGEVIYG